MAKLHLTLSCGTYDRTWALAHGEVQPEGIELNYISPNSPSVTFWRMLKYREFDVAELSLSNYTILRSRGEDDLIGIPIFPNRVFRHSAFWVNTRSAIERPQDLVGKRMGVAEYPMTAAVWGRGILQDEFGVRPEQITWYTGGLYEAGRTDRIDFEVPTNIQIQSVANRTLNSMLEEGAIDALLTPKPYFKKTPAVRCLFSDPRQVEEDFFRRTGIFPIMHTIAIRRDVYDKNRWIAASLYEAFERSKQLCYRWMKEGGRYVHPWFPYEIERVTELMGADPYENGLTEGNRKSIQTLQRFLLEQGLAPRIVPVESLFAESTLQLAKE